LYVDGEMPLADLQSRSSAILHGERPETLRLLPSETLYLKGQPLTINNPKQQERFEKMLDELESQGQMPEVIIFDNLSSLTAGMDENSNSDLDDFLLWLLKLRHRGLAVILVHHAGKNGDQRGASRREDLLDTSIMLREPKNDEFTLRQGACFEISFTKTRGKRPQPDVIEVELATDERGNVAWQIGDAQNVPAWLKSLKVIRDEEPASQVELAGILKVTEAAVAKQLKTPRSRGFLEAGKLQLTDQGARLVEQTFDNF
jgi:putative DNA primase/helicase